MVDETLKPIFDRLSAATERTTMEAMRSGRDMALDAAIELCEEAARTGHGADCCVKMLQDLKASLPAAPSRQN